jgi:hypothetical protein
MSKKEIKLHKGFMDENGNLVEIPENIQKHIEAREEFWVDKIKDIDSKCGIVLKRLAITEKALELACEELNKLKKEYMSQYNFTAENEINAFKILAKEMK